jgi:hypothetical protein
MAQKQTVCCNEQSQGSAFVLKAHIAVGFVWDAVDPGMDSLFWVRVTDVPMKAEWLAFQDALSTYAQAVQGALSTLFQRLDPTLDPQLAILALPFDPDAEIIVVPSEGLSSASESFRSLGDLLSTIPELHALRLYPDQQPVLGQAKRQLCQAVQAILDEYTCGSAWRPFTVLPEFIHHYCLFLIVQVSQAQLQNHYWLTRNAVRTAPTETSFVHEVILRCLDEYSLLLMRLAEGNGVRQLPHGPEEILRQAGHWLMRTPGHATGGADADSLFQACNAISALRYEGSEGSGRLLIAAPTHPSVHVQLHLQQPVHLRNYRGIRKLLEVSTDDLHLLYAADHIYGVGQLSAVPYNEAEENLFVVEFAGAHTWRLLHANHSLMVVSYGLPRLPRRPLRKEHFEAQVSEHFPALGADHLADLWHLAVAATQQTRGAMVVISANAQAEAQRLQHQATLIAPCRLTPELMVPVSSIDGAILIEPDATCHAIGVILDGVASDQGNPARGARYNSAVRYKEYSQQRQVSCLILVCSEDGTVDLL